MRRRLVLLVSAMAIAAIGALLIFAYVKHADDRALAGQQPVAILVAKHEIASGTQVSTAISTGAFVSKKVAAATVSIGALTAAESIKDEVALTTIFPGQQILSGMFGKTSETKSTSSLPLPDGKLALSFQFTDPARVAGFVEPGSRVAVFFAESSAAADKDLVSTLFQSVQVIAVGPTTVTPAATATPANTEQLPRALLTLALTQDEALRLVYASEHGSLYLGLLNDKSQVTAGRSIGSPDFSH